MTSLRNELKFILAALVMIGFSFALYSQRFLREETTGIKKKFPSEVRGWVSNDVPFDPEVEAVLRPDSYVFKTFSKKAASPVTLFLARYNEIEKGDLSHSPIVCLTAQGWEIKKVSEETIETGIAAVPRVQANMIRLQKLNTEMVVLYWYQSVDRALASRGYQKLILFVDHFSGKPYSNAFVRLSSPVGSGWTTDKVSADLCDFVRQVLPEILDFMR